MDERILNVDQIKETPSDTESETTQTSGSESASKIGDEPPPLAIERKVSSAKRGSKATGPRTELGKERASRNAIKHGVFSKVVLLKGEPQNEYERLWAEFREALQPEGAAEEHLVEKLVNTAWRQRRLLLAESAEIRKNTEFFNWDRQNRERGDDESIASLFDAFERPGLIEKIHTPGPLERSLELLSELQEQIKVNGLDEKRDTALLDEIYGDKAEGRLHKAYRIWLHTSGVREKERAREGCASQEQCRRKVLKEIEQEIRRLRRYHQLEVFRHNVPDAPGLDRLLRYEASLERNFDRTMSQLERLQRMRLGQPVPPPIKVSVSSS